MIINKTQGFLQSKKQASKGNTNTTTHEHTHTHTHICMVVLLLKIYWGERAARNQKLLWPTLRGLCYGNNNNKQKAISERVVVVLKGVTAALTFSPPKQHL